MKRAFLGFDLDGWKHQSDRDPFVITFPRSVERHYIPRRLDVAFMLNAYCKLVWPGRNLRSMLRRRQRRVCIFPTLSKYGVPMRNQPMARQTYQLRFQALLQRARVPHPERYTAGCGRSGGATAMLRAGVSARIVQRIARWCDDRMLDTYERPDGSMVLSGQREMLRGWQR